MNESLALLGWVKPRFLSNAIDKRQICHTTIFRLKCSTLSQSLHLPGLIVRPPKNSSPHAPRSSNSTAYRRNTAARGRPGRKRGQSRRVELIDRWETNNMGARRTKPSGASAEAVSYSGRAGSLEWRRRCIPRDRACLRRGGTLSCAVIRQTQVQSWKVFTSDFYVPIALFCVLLYKQKRHELDLIDISMPFLFVP